MLELDVLLGNFLTEHYLLLSEKDQQIFVKLLACEDQDLFMWLMNNETSKDPDLQIMVGKIQKHARNRH